MRHLVLAFLLLDAAGTALGQTCPEPPELYPQTGFYTRIDAFGERLLGWDLELRRIALLDAAGGAPAPLAFRPADGVEDVALVGSLAAVVDGPGLRLLDADDPALNELSALSTSGYFLRVDLAAGLAAVYDQELREVVLVDVTDPAVPVVAGRYPAGEVRDLALRGTDLLLALETGLAWVDVSNPAAPTLMATRADLGPFAALAAAGGYLVAHDLEFARLSVFDLALPGLPLLGFTPAGDPRDVAVYPCRAWVAQAAPGRSGLEALDLVDCGGCDPRCVEDGATLCLNERRFRLQARWRTAGGQAGTAGAVRLTADTGYFWFFDPDNVEVVAKVLDACAAFDRYWMFAAGLTNVEVVIEVEDLDTGVTRRYENPLRQPFQPVLDTAAFPTCP
ncbi:MAG TPA: hypothetical protein VHQ65_14595 [Thermoanaerobaculia bacterium]|nr:hypothetical protein [Thermoanaerobaculia bacterium]